MVRITQVDAVSMHGMTSEIQIQTVTPMKMGVS